MLLTIFSASNYGGACRNKGGVLIFDEQGPAENVTPAPGSQPAVCACSGSGRCPLGIQPAQKHAQESEEERGFLHTSQLMYPVRRCSGRTSARK